MWLMEVEMYANVVEEGEGGCGSLDWMVIFVLGKVVIWSIGFGTEGFDLWRVDGGGLLTAVGSWGHKSEFGDFMTNLFYYLFETRVFWIHHIKFTNLINFLNLHKFVN